MALPVNAFRAILIEKAGDGQSVRLAELAPDALMEGEVLIRVEHSTLNYKDGLALTGRAPVVRRFPMIPGVDLAGTVLASSDPLAREGSRVVVNGWGMGETHHGGYAGLARVKAGWAVGLEDFTTAEAMAIGTAGYTAMLAVLALEKAGLAPARGPVLVTGAAGGVGSVAIALLGRLGYEVIAATGRPEEADYLRGLGAHEILPRSELEGPPRALGKERWAAVVDAAGSKVLANALAMTRYGGAVAACGLAAGMDLPGSVMPFILRGVALLGIDSVMAPRALRLEAWQRLARDLDRGLLARMTRHVGLAEVMALGPEILAGRVRGRIVVDLQGG